MNAVPLSEAVCIAGPRFLLWPHPLNLRMLNNSTATHTWQFINNVATVICIYIYKLASCPMYQKVFIFHIDAHYNACRITFESSVPPLNMVQTLIIKSMTSMTPEVCYNTVSWYGPWFYCRLKS